MIKSSILLERKLRILTLPALSMKAVLLTKAADGISEIKKDESGIKIFPNPAKDNLNISLSPTIAGKTEIAVYDMKGRKMLYSFVDFNGDSPLSFDISALESGVYFFQSKINILLKPKRFRL
jgi:hypothetical protein